MLNRPYNCFECHNIVKDHKISIPNEGYSKTYFVKQKRDLVKDSVEYFT